MRLVVEIKIRVRSKFPPIKKPQAGLDFTALWGGIEKEFGVRSQKKFGESREYDITRAGLDVASVF